MRERIRRLISTGERGEPTPPLGLSLRRGRCGWMVTSQLEVRLVRALLATCCARVVPVYLDRQGGPHRLFLEPRWPVLGASLERRPRTAPFDLFSPAQQERLRRLSLCLAQKPSRVADPRSGQALFRGLALRLEFVSDSTDAGKVWRHLAADFDRLWETVPIFAVRLTPFQRSVVRALRRAVGLTSSPSTVRNPGG